MAGGPPVGNDGDPFTFEALEDLLDHIAELQANLPLGWTPRERRRLHDWARWVAGQGCKSAAIQDWLVQHSYKVVGFGESAPLAGAAHERHERHEPPRMTLAVTAADAPTAPEPGPGFAAQRTPWRAGWVVGWVVGCNQPRTPSRVCSCSDARYDPHCQVHGSTR